MDKFKKPIKKYSIITLSQIITGIGVAIMVKSGMGNDPWGVMISGLSYKTGITYGVVNNTMSMAILILLLIFYRKRISPTTLICALVIGWTVDPTMVLLSKLNPPVLLNNFGYPIIACFIISIGVAMCLAMDYGAGTTDNLILLICDKTNKTYAFGCYTLYIVFLAIGLLLKGTWGYATVVALLLNGKLIDFFIPKFEKLNAWTEN